MLKEITNEELKKIIENHQHYLNQDCDGWENMQADLSYTNLQGVDLQGINLSDADFEGSNLRHANLANANLEYATINFAVLKDAKVAGANLKHAQLQEADLSWADLKAADLRWADLTQADLSYAILKDTVTVGVDMKDTFNFTLNNAFESYAKMPKSQKDLITKYYIYRNVEYVFDKNEVQDNQLLKEIGDFAYETWIDCHYEEVDVANVAYGIAEAVIKDKIDLKEIQELDSDEIVSRALDRNWYFGKDKGGEL